MNAYCILLRGQVNVEEVNTMSPHLMTAIRIEPGTTLVRIETDQAGMIGALIHLHNLGLTLLSIEWVEG